MIKTFGFPQMMMGGDGGGGGGGEGESGLDAFAMSQEEYEQAINSPPDLGPPSTSITVGATGTGGTGVGTGGLSGVDASSFSGPSGGLGDVSGISGYNDSDAFGGGSSDTFSDPGQYGAHAYTGGLGYGLDQFASPNFATRGPSGWGFASNPQPSVAAPTFMGRFGAINDGTHAIGAANFANPGTNQSPVPAWVSPFSEPSRGLPQQLFDDRFTGLPGKGLSPWAPGPAIGQIAVTPSQTNQGSHSQAAPGQSAPTQAFGLPAAMHPGWTAGELDWNAIAGSGIDSMISDRAGTVSPETLAIQQSQYIPQWAEAYGPTPGYWHNNRGAIDPAMLEIEAAQNRPQYIQAYGPTPGYWADERGAISDQDPEVLAMIARGLGPRG
jgi:hypothetical protein